MTDAPPPIVALLSPVPDAVLGVCAFCKQPIADHSAFFVVGVGLHHRAEGPVLPSPLDTNMSRPVHSSARLVCESCGMGRKIIAQLLEDR